MKDNISLCLFAYLRLGINFTYKVLPDAYLHSIEMADNSIVSNNYAKYQQTIPRPKTTIEYSSSLLYFLQKQYIEYGIENNCLSIALGFDKSLKKVSVYNGTKQTLGVNEIIKKFFYKLNITKKLSDNSRRACKEIAVSVNSDDCCVLSITNCQNNTLEVPIFKSRSKECISKEFEGFIAMLDAGIDILEIKELLQLRSYGN